jgi:hypothetical protein
MATVDKNFRIKNGLVVEGSTATVNGQNILTETGSDQYILDLIGGETLVKSVSNEFDVSAGGELSLDRATVDAYYDAAGSAATAQSNAEDYADGLAVNYDAAGSAAAAQSAAESYADGLISTAAGDLTDHENATEAHGATGAVVGTTNTQTLSNKTISYTDNTITVQVANVSDLTASASELNTLDGITASTAELNVLDGITATTTELNYVDGVTSGIQGQLDDKAPLDSPALTGTPTAPTAAAGTNSTQVATTAYADAAVAALVDSAPATLDTLNELAAALQDNPDIISDLQDIAAGKQDTLTAGSNIDITGSTISVTGLSTDDVAEDAGNKYFTDQRALDATAAAYDVVGSAAGALEQANDYTDGEITTALTTAQGYADTAEQNAEATAQAALDDVLDSTTPFTELNLNDVAKQVAATTGNIATAAATTAYSWAAADFRSAKFVVKAKNGVHTQVSDLVVTLDTSNNVAVSEYGITYSNGTELAAVTADYSGSDVRIRVIPASDNTEVIVVGTLIK